MDHPWMYTMDHHGETPTTRARKSGYTVLAELLLSQEREEAAKHSSAVSPPASDENAYWGMSRTVHRMVSDSPTASTPVTPIDQLLHQAAREGDLKRAQALLEEGANVDRENELGLAPLHWSALNGRADLAEMLLDHGADINQREGYTGKLTPMAMALLMGYDDVVELMAGRGGTC